MKRHHATHVAAGILALAATAVPAGDTAEYRHVLDGSPLAVPTEGAGLSEAVRRFHRTGENPYVGDPAALKVGREIYDARCAACHMPDGSGRIGSSFLDGSWNYDYTATMEGRFAIVYGGGAGAMQAFSDRLSQDQILQVLAYIEKLRADAE